MKRPGPSAPPSIDPVATAGTLAALAGLASIGWPFFSGMTAALSALTLLGGLVVGKRRAAAWRRPIGWVALAAALIGWTFFLTAPGSMALFRAAVLGATSALVAAVAQSRPAFGG
ncbi:MAG TPA: hypothetical protein VGX00_03985 [Thermoplasmata archaeon]|nr:hypothetical protein [Thermoplasmata archaeon]